MEQGESRLKRIATIHTGALVLALSALPGMTAPAHADVTTQESTALEAFGVKMHGTSIERTTADKQRRQSEYHCEGFMSLLCGNTKTDDIIRIDRSLEWQLDPKDKTYLETPFPTPEERAAAQQKMQETMEKIKQCQQQQPQQPAQPAADTSKCQMSPPRIDVRQTDDHATLAGHDTRKSSVTLTQTCTDQDTGDVCELVYGFDVWLTGDELAGAADRREFGRAYMKKLGLDENTPAMKDAAQKFLAQYAGTMKDLAAKAKDLKGTPLRTTFRFSMGGEHCGKAKDASSQGGSSSGGGGLGGISSLGGLASQAGSKLLGGLMARKSSGSSSGSDPNAPPPAVPGEPPRTQIIAFTIETTAIDTAAIPAEQFELPAGWKLEKPKPAKEQEFTCPTHGK
jgi:hypothetical protein